MSETQLGPDALDNLAAEFYGQVVAPSGLAAGDPSENPETLDVVFFSFIHPDIKGPKGKVDGNICAEAFVAALESFRVIPS